MKKQFLIAFLIFVSCHVFAKSPVDSVECWKRFEVSLKGSSSGNPFTDIWLTAEFSKGTQKYLVDGFYDGEGIFKLRFMPSEPGEWKYTTKSNNKTLNGKNGSFYCTAASTKSHGPVKVSATYNFKYADSTNYYPFGTTLYAWIHQGEALQQQTLQTLKSSGFNKVRMCVFPKYYSYVENDPELFLYIQTGTKKDSAGKTKRVWDFSRFNPAFFRHLENRIDDLRSLGIEADIIIFHPYDKGHWGFDSMGKEADLRYIKYLVSRLSSYSNVWWSMANEWDFVQSKSRQDWDTYTKAVVAADPYKHLCSIHNGNTYYDNWKPEFTHVSIQNGSAVEDFGRANLLRDVYFKPVIYDEVCYEGNLPLRWGQLTGEQMTSAFWQGIIAGTYVTHGETFLNKSDDTVFWAKGGKLRGSSPSRIAFLRSIMEQGPGPVQLADEWKDYHTAMCGTGYYLIYFGNEKQEEWPFNLPKKNGPQPGTKYKVDIIDTWDMTITPYNETFETDTPKGYRILDKQNKKIKLPLKPYLALRITKIAG